MCVDTITKAILIVLNTVLAMVAFVMVVLGVVTLYAADYIVSFFLEPLLEQLRANGFPQASMTQQGFDLYAILQNVAIPLIVCGLALFIIGCSGCCGASCDNRICLIVYAAVIGAVIAIELIVIIVMAGGQDEWKSMAIAKANTYLQDNYSGSNGTDALTVIANVLFMKFNCCTINDVTLATQTSRFAAASNFDKSQSQYYIPAKNAYYNGPIVIPFTCCVMDQPFPVVSPVDVDCAKNPTTTTAYIETACFNLLMNFLLTYQVHCIMGAVCVILVELLILVLTIMLIKSIGESKII